jgi:transposase
MERKVKYTLDFKMECVKLVLEKQYSCEAVSKQKGPNKSNIRMWVNFYNKYGESGLFPRKNQSYTIDFKLKVLKSIEKKLLSLRETCVEFNIPSMSIIIKWQRDFADFGIEGLNKKPRGRPKTMTNFKRKKRKSDKPLSREEELLLENEVLRAELDLLKKLQALTQAKKKQKP